MYILCNYTSLFLLLLLGILWLLIWYHCVYSSFSLMYILQSDWVPQNKHLQLDCICSYFHQQNEFMPYFSRLVLVFQVQVFCINTILELSRVYLNVAALRKVCLDLVADNQVFNQVVSDKKSYAYQTMHCILFLIE